MKILLINPPRFNQLVGIVPGELQKHRGASPPLGLLYLASYIREHTPYLVEVIDAQPLEWSYDKLEQEISGRTFDFCGITAMTFTLLDVIKTCHIVRKVRPEAKIILGGPHAHLFPKETLSLPDVDFLIMGEGEIPLATFLNKFDNPAAWPNIRGLGYIDSQGRMVDGGLAETVQQLDMLGFPARDLIDQSLYSSVLGQSRIIGTMFTSRGCPFKCTFCNRQDSASQSQFRWHSAQHVADEIEQCLGMGIQEALIYDDTFTINKERVYALCDEIATRGLQFIWDVRAHVATVDEKLLKRMAEVGCKKIHFGVESGNDRMLKTIRKGANIDRVRKAFQYAKIAGMETLAYFILGQQTETREDIEDTFRLARELDPDYIHFSIFCPLPGTQVYHQGIEKGIVKNDVWREFSKNPTMDFLLPVWEENFSRDELSKMIVKGYKSFYLRPSYLIRRLGKIQSINELVKKARIGFSMFTMRGGQNFFRVGN